MAILTEMARFGRARAFVDSNATGTWIGFGKTDTPWTGDPPAAVGNETELLELGCYKLCTTVTYIIEDETAIADFIVYQGVRWRKLLEAEALSEKCRWVYIEAVLDETEGGLLDEFSFRQAGVFTGVERAAGYLGRSLLRVSGFGAGTGATEDEFIATDAVLEVIDNLETTTHKATYVDTLAYILQF